jgi:uncharacterized Zn finger protein
VPRESAHEKGVRLAGSGRLTLRRLEEDVIVAKVRGDSARIYSTGWTPAGWFCTCPFGENASPGRACSHVRALQLVVLEPLPSIMPPPPDTEEVPRWISALA